MINQCMHAAVEGCNSSMVVERHVNCLNTLLEHEASINYEREQKRTVLMTASSKGFIELVRELLNLNANVNQADIQG